MKTLALIFLIITPSAFAQLGQPGQTSEHPFFIVELAKFFVDPLEQEDDCDSRGGIIAKVNCHLIDMGVNGPGQFEKDGIKVVVLPHSQFDYQVIASTREVIFFNYLFNQGGQNGKMRIYPDLPDDNSNLIPRFAIEVQWDSQNPAQQIIHVKAGEMNSHIDRSWSNRHFALELYAEINSIAQVSRVWAGYSGKDGEGRPEGYKMRLIRNAEYSVGYGQTCDVNGLNCQNIAQGSAQCVSNPTPAAGGFDFEGEQGPEPKGTIVLASNDLNQVTNNSLCSFGSELDTNLGSVQIDESQLNLFTSSIMSGF